MLMSPERALIETNVKMYGAVGDGIHDDTVAIQAAIDAVGNTGIIYFPKGTYRCLNKLRIGRGVSSYGWTFAGEMSGYTETGMPIIYLDPASTDLVLLELDQASGVEFHSLSLKGPGAGLSVPGSYVFTATDVNADVDIVFRNCSLGYAAMCGKVDGRGLLVDGCNVTFVGGGFDITWPNPFVPLGGDDQYPGSGMRAYRITNCRFHGWSGDYLIKNVGANAHNINSFLIEGNYADTAMRLWNGHIRKTVINANIFINIIGVNSTITFMNIPADLNAVGGIVNQDVTISSNYFGGQHDTTYVSGGNPSVYDRWMGSFLTASNVSGLKVTDNSFFMTSRDVHGLTDIYDFTFKGNTYRDVCLDAARTLTLTSQTGVYVAGETVTGGTSGATGIVALTATTTLRLNSVTGTFQVGEVVTGGTSAATGTVATTSLTARYPFRFNSGSFTNGYIGDEHLITAQTGNGIPFIGYIAGTITDVLIDKLYYDNTKWGYKNYIVSSFVNVLNDNVKTYLLKNGDGVIYIEAANGATMEASIISYKGNGTNAIQIMSDPSAVYSVASNGTVLTGTTGTAGKINVSVVVASGIVTLYVENRRGGTRAVNLIESGPNR